MIVIIGCILPIFVVALSPRPLVIGLFCLCDCLVLGLILAGFATVASGVIDLLVCLKEFHVTVHLPGPVLHQLHHLTHNLDLLVAQLLAADQGSLNAVQRSPLLVAVRLPLKLLNCAAFIVSANPMCYDYYHDGLGFTAHSTALASEVPGGVGFILSAGAKKVLIDSASDHEFCKGRQTQIPRFFNHCTTRAIPGTDSSWVTHVSPVPRGRWPVPRIPGAGVGGICFVLSGARNTADKPCLRHRGAAIAPRPEVAWLGSWSGRGHHQANGAASSGRRTPPREPPPMGGHRAAGGGQTGSKSRSRIGEHGPPRSADSQSKAGSRATRRHSNQFNLLPPPSPSTKEKKEGRGNTDRCQSQRKARPHPAQRPMAQERTDKDIPWGRHSQSKECRSWTFPIC
ncbi:hypothetical protein MDA_GLEAN10017039 [Myotis davidii]|uniref:Uncharacterized protein n=1 Tax=Myotis davidii TaxID=225400 RepID=L5LH07_MYODS|nr:hypothetical protein MDA_GLEAN10017039 [Myotis davidii]